MKLDVIVNFKRIDVDPEKVQRFKENVATKGPEIPWVMYPVFVFEGEAYKHSETFVDFDSDKVAYQLVHLPKKRIVQGVN